MTLPLEEISDALEAMYRDGDYERMLPYLTDDVVLDWSDSMSPYRGVYEGHDGARRLIATFTESFDLIRWKPTDFVTLGERAAMGTVLVTRGAGSGAEVRSEGGSVWEFAGERLRRIKLLQSRADALRWMRAERLAEARLYFVCEGLPGGADPAPLLDAALSGGADIVQLREGSPRCAEEIAALAEPFRRAAASHGALFVLNDQPELVEMTGADGVHVGQDDAPVARARADAGAGAIVGLSTHGPDQLAAAEAAAGGGRPDYVSIGPIWETPTKPGRAATGLDYARRAAAEASLPWFAIGGIDAANVGEVAAAGARRAVVVRAIRDAADPEAVARELREALGGLMANREDKRTQRQRKARGAERRAMTEERRARMAERAETKNQAARDKLEPLGPNERPTVVTIGAVIAGLIALAVVVAYLAGAEVNGQRPAVIQVITPAFLMGMAAFGMWRARYWAVLGFQVVLAFLIIAAAIGLVTATSPVQIIGNFILIGVAGTLFFFMIKALARLQMPERPTRPPL